MKRGALVLLVLLSTYALFAVPVYVRIYPWSNTEREILALEAVLQRYLDPDATAYVTNDDRYIIQWEMGDIDPDDFFARIFIGQGLEMLESILDARCDWQEYTDYILCTYHIVIDSEDVKLNIRLFDTLLKMKAM